MYIHLKILKLRQAIKYAITELHSFNPDSEAAQELEALLTTQPNTKQLEDAVKYALHELKEWGATESVKEIEQSVGE